jgi:D-glycero-D-manno-heptose 1,7-bisphosphate phosphatase
MFPAIFLDRDGVIIENVSSYVRSWADVSIFPQAVQALARLSYSPYKFVIVTNQAGIGKGLFSQAEADSINQRLIGEIERAGGRIDGVFMCPHTPHDNCDCRKPKPGLFLQASRQLAIDLTRSIAIGDRWFDLQAAHAAGIPRLSLVKTGLGAGELLQPKPPILGEVSIYTTLAEAFEKLAESGNFTVH